MIIFTLLMITISGIAAIPRENFIENNSRSMNKIKRDIGYGGKRGPTTFHGGPVSIYFRDENCAINFIGPLIGTPQVKLYEYIKFNITRDLGITSWDTFRSNYQWAEFSKELHIEFSRTDGLGEKFDVRLVPNKFKLTDVKLLDYNPEKSYDKSATLYYLNGMSLKGVEAMSIRDSDFDVFVTRQELFSEGIWVGAARVGATVHVALQGYTSDGYLIFKIMYRVRFSHFASTAGITFKLNGDNDLTLK